MWWTKSPNSELLNERTSSFQSSNKNEYIKELLITFYTRSQVSVSIIWCEVLTLIGYHQDTQSFWLPTYLLCLVIIYISELDLKLFIFLEKPLSVSCEKINKSTRRRAQLVPIGMPTAENMSTKHNKYVGNQKLWVSWWYPTRVSTSHEV
jgi:hypothetical protein